MFQPTADIVACQDFPAIGEHLRNCDVGFWTDFILTARATRDRKPEISTDPIHVMCLPNLRDSRTLDRFADEDAVFLRDDCPSHVSEEINGLLRDSTVLITNWSPHRIQICQ
jgi:hypothetical protein